MSAAADPNDSEIGRWLESRGLGQYSAQFFEHGISLEVLHELTDADLKECGMAALGHRKQLLAAIRDLSAAGTDAPVAPPVGDESREQVPTSAREPADRYPSYDTLPTDLAAVETEGAGAGSFDPTRKAAFNLPPPSYQTGGSRTAVTAASGASAAHRTPVTPVLQAPTHFAPAPEKPSFMAKLLTRKFLVVSILVHLLFGLGATVFIVQRSQAKRKVTFQGGPPAVTASKRALEHKVSMAQKKKTGGAPPQAKRIVSAGLAKVSLPEMPNIPTATTVVPGMMSGMGGAGFGTGMGFGSGMGSGMGGGTGTGGGGLTMFGVRGGSAGLIGTFYDLKQTKDRKPTDMAGGGGGMMDWKAPQVVKCKELVSRFVKGGWNPSILNHYFAAPGKVSAQQIFIPNMVASEGPKAFQVEKEVAPSRWLVHYTGEIIAPKDGKFRFIGAGDDTLVVRCKGRNVLDGSFPEFLVDPAANESMDVGRAWLAALPLRAGKWIEMRKGEPMKMEVLIGENPGGEFSCFLMAEENGVDHPPGVFPVFQLKAMDVPTGSAPQHHGAIVFSSKVAGGSLLDSLRR
jgi:hypothetical protein